jgi:oxygen-independent coproporphyrinogen III oxidase
MESNLDKAVPRYTSYPTAPHFNSDVNDDVFRSWLEALPEDATLSLYLHVPYCRTLCHYCGCHTKATLRRDPIDDYAQRLGEEIATVARYAGKRRVTHLHWGGGTPSILGSDALKSIGDEIYGSFNCAVTREHAIELDPRYLTRPLTQTLRDIGVNRASLGVQDFSAHVQSAAGRIQSFDLVANAAAMLRAVGIDRINLDLMYGLPKQTVQDVQRTATLAHALKPRRIAVFGYAHVPWFKPQQRLIEMRDLPSGPERLAQAKAAHETLVQLGYHPIGLDHYALADDELATATMAGRLRRNFQGYTVDDADALLGLGVSAISRLPQGFAQNAPDVGNYSRAVAVGQLATVRGIALSTDDRVRGHIIEQLMCSMAVDLTAITGSRGLNIENDISNALDLLQPFEEDGTLVIDGGRIEITEKGRPFVRLVASAFDAYLTRNRARHAPAV